MNLLIGYNRSYALTLFMKILKRLQNVYELRKRVLHKFCSPNVGASLILSPPAVREGIEGRAVKPPSAFPCQISSFCPLLNPPPRLEEAWGRK